MNTIAALATPPGTGAIGVIRISGPRALPVLSDLFLPRRMPVKWKARKVYLGRLQDGANYLDRVLVTVFRAPSSYTGEDTVEISCHGGPVLLRKVLEVLFRHGIQPAAPGAFTERAFLNGKMDLLQAEAVLDVINAGSDLALCAAQELLEGRLTDRVQDFKQSLIDLACELEAEIEFPEESDVLDQKATLTRLRSEKIQSIIDSLTPLLDSFDQGYHVREGFTVAICGAPNTGKSTLLNALLGYERALTSEIPGTTRDYIREKIFLKGLPITVLDTAGIRNARDTVEQQGIQQGQKMLEKSSLVLLVLDGSRPLHEDDRRAIASCPANVPCLLLVNKSDLPRALLPTEGIFSRHPSIPIAALSGNGIPDLLEHLTRELGLENLSRNTSLLITHLRHKNSLERCRDALVRGRETLAIQGGTELTAYEIREGLHALQELTGEITVEHILEGIFHRFCIGK